MMTWKERRELRNTIGDLKVYSEPFKARKLGNKYGAAVAMVTPDEDKCCATIEEAIKRSGLKNGMTISFHHHFRSGDAVINLVMDVIDKMGFRGLTLAASSLSSVHDPLIELIRKGVIRKIETSGLRGKLADKISAGLMDEPVVFRSHGGRARAIEAGETRIDVAFLGVPCSDAYGNANGYKGKGICGSLGYAKVDAANADYVVLITDDLVPYPNMPASITQNQVDAVVVVDNIGDPEKIASGATRFTKNPKELQIARFAADIIESSPYFKDGFSFQTGSGGASLAVTRQLRERMLKNGIKASFALGGITKPMVELHEEGLIGTLFDVQSFDLAAAESLKRNHGHIEIDASLYANIHSKGCAANKLNVVILSALEIDTAFNVNVLTASNGVIMGASGGHSDTAACADMTIVVAPLFRGRIPTLVEEVQTVVTPGECVDVLVTERGVAINPIRQDLITAMSDAGVPILSIEALLEQVQKIVGIPKPIKYSDKVVGIVEYRDGSVIDCIRAVQTKD